MRLTEAVLRVLSAHTSPGELEKVFGIFPPELRALCLERKNVDLSDLG
jgi:uncharacterized protein (DUF2267 family)